MNNRAYETGYSVGQILGAMIVWTIFIFIVMWGIISISVGLTAFIVWDYGIIEEWSTLFFWEGFTFMVSTSFLVSIFLVNCNE